MHGARGHAGGERAESMRKVRRRIRDGELLATRDLLMLEFACRGWTHERIAGTFRVARPLVTVRLKHRIPAKIRRAMEAAAYRYPDGLPIEVSDRLREALMEERDRAQKDRRAG